ncbi:MAG: FAD-binding oxidoreductase [Desertifilum sp.]|nr:FAD-binding oxidoreductase [Desertifilum sp.]
MGDDAHILRGRLSSVKAIAPQLESLVSTDGVIPFSEASPVWQSQIQQATQPESLPQCIVYPRTSAELSEVMQLAHRENWRVLPCGQGSKLHWGGFAQGVDLVLSTQRLNRLIDHAIGDLTVTVEAGMSFAELQHRLHEAGQFLAFDPAYPETATLGGIVATADTGSWRQAYGGVRDRLIGLSFVRSDGQIAKAGGRVVKNVAGYDLMKLLTGSYGTLGILTQLSFRLYPWSQESETGVLQGNPQAIEQATRTLLKSALTPTVLDLVSENESVLKLIVRFQSIPEAVKQQSTQLLELAASLSLEADLYTGTFEDRLWQQLRDRMANGEILCKIGIRPTQAVPFMSFLAQFPATATIHARSGLGKLRLDTDDPQIVQQVRSHLEAHQGFLTLLEAPIELKQKLDIWGYSGNALEPMRRLKQQFDPTHLLSPGRFVGGI